MYKVERRHYCKNCKRVHFKGEMIEAETCRYCNSHTSELFDLKAHGLPYRGSACRNCTQTLYNQEKLRGLHTDPWCNMMMGMGDTD